MNNDLPRRNGEAVLATLREQDVKLADLHQRVAGLGEAVATLMLRVQQMERLLIVQQVTNMGNGPTVKG